MATSYMISEEGWTVEDALERFTARRMRNNFGPGISIPSQARWIRYVDWWTRHGKVYVERQIEVLEVHVWGLREGVKVDVQGYVDNGKTIKVFHTFSRHEKTSMDETEAAAPPILTSPVDASPVKGIETPVDRIKSDSQSLTNSPRSSTDSRKLEKSDTASSSGGGETVLFRPSKPLILPTSDINIDFERRNKARYGFTMVTSVAHVWFNTYFESQYDLEKQGFKDASSGTEGTLPTIDVTNPPSSGVFTIAWDAMDGLKGSSRKGTRAFDQFSIVWRAVIPSTAAHAEPQTVITEPAPGEAPEQTGPSDRNEHSRIFSDEKSKMKRNLGLRTQSPIRDISRSSSPVSAEPVSSRDDDSERGIQSFVPEEKRPGEGPNSSSEVAAKTSDHHPKPDDTSHLPEKEDKIPGEIILESKQR